MIIYNGEVFQEDKVPLNFNNRAFRYGDGLFESMRMLNGEIPFWDRHWIRLQDSMATLQMSFSSLNKIHDLKQQIIDLAKGMSVDNSSRIRLSVFRKNNGFYFTSEKSADYIVEILPLEQEGFQFNKNGLYLDLVPYPAKLSGPFSSIKTISSLAFVMAGFEAASKKTDDVILLNEKGKVCETANSNIFLFRGKQVFTPPVSEGCVEGIMRSVVIDICRDNKISLQEKSISSNEVLEAEEIFLTNAVKGIQWVAGFRTKRYFGNFSASLSTLLNQSVQ